MKTLIIGLDGLSRNIFKRSWTPNINELLNKSFLYEFHEDLISRGWSEIFTGSHAKNTGAMYEYPNMNESYTFSEKINLRNIKKKIKIWDLYINKNKNVGVMNVPTIYSAPSVQGFFVSGGGGGKSELKLDLILVAQRNY